MPSVFPLENLWMWCKINVCWWKILFPQFVNDIKIYDFKRYGNMMIMYEKLSQMKEMFAEVNWIVTETSEFLI